MFLEVFFAFLPSLFSHVFFFFLPFFFLFLSLVPQEGITSEASSLAGHLGLGKLILLYDDNSVSLFILICVCVCSVSSTIRLFACALTPLQIQIDGETELAFTEDVVKRYEAYGWHTQVVKDGDNGA